MMEIEAMTDGEVFQELEALNEKFSDAEFDTLEQQLKLRAASLHWTGDPFKQPPRAVLACARLVIDRQRTKTESAERWEAMLQKIERSQP